MLTQLCRDMTDLSAEDIAQLEEVARQLPLMAELSQGDMFIDCPLPDGQAVVAAHARPSTSGSAYRRPVVGRRATQEREPAVFHAFRLRTPVRDIKAITQEDRTVLQDVVPIFNAEQRCIALLICEKDISGELRQEKKLQTLSKSYEQADPTLRGGEESADAVSLREVHHRVKNNLQLVASILSLQARRCSSEDTKKILLENVGRVLSIAAIHDILTSSTDGFRQVDSLALLEHLQKNLQSLVPGGKQISIQVVGTHVPLPADVASSMALVVNELVSNALRHAFKGRSCGHIEISFCAGSLYHTVTVSDDGTGFDQAGAEEGSHLGLTIVEATVRDKLKGHLTICSDPGGSRASFDFKTE